MGRPSTLTICIEEQFNPTPRSWQAEAGVEAAFGKNPIERLLVGDMYITILQYELHWASVP